ncbi:TonB-dependent receptor plug domain-containing protein [Colwellia piezophila]|uniref:TonB-dependent receptor plug domain-containing protein n=1 Tax=Colwellia piezophila TaxID=211668 RepID=UPI00037B012C|nr:TonB-dependent receptor [Colwellia piezophila]
MENIIRLTASLIISCSLFCSPAQSEVLENLFNLSLEELLEVRVSVASTKPETVVETPAIVSRYNRTDLEKMGITTLREMFNFIPGVIVQDSIAGWASVQIRGIDEAFNQKVLFLLDGIPYHQPSHSLIPMEGIPWESISHVEVIRGPGAVFYGTQASGGVFNVITRKDIGKSSASVKIGSNGLKEGSGYFNREFSDDSAIYFAAEYRTEDGYTATYNEVFPNVGLVTGEVDRYLERQSGLLRYTNNEFSLLFQAFSDTTVGINDGVTGENTLQPLTLETKGQLIHIDNNWSTDNSRTIIFSDYNHYTFDIKIENAIAPGVGILGTKDNNGKDDYRFRVGGSFVYNMNQSLELAVGVEHETRSVGDYRIYLLDDPSTPLATSLEKSKLDEFSAYAQVDYTLENWRFLIGGRFTDNELSGKKTTPRAAIVYKIDEYQSLKTLYSTGFNSPNPTQTSVYAPGNVIGNESLTAEIVKTFDFAYSYSKSNVLFVANIYALEAEDFIERRFSEADGAVSFFNEGNFKRQGAEIDFQMATSDSKLFINLAYQKEGNKVIAEDPTAFNTPRLTLSIGASTDLWDMHSIGGNITYIGARHNLDGYSIVNINYTARLSDFDLFIVVRNLLDAEILNPDISTQNSDLVAHGEEGVNFQLGVRVYF